MKRVQLSQYKTFDCIARSQREIPMVFFSVSLFLRFMLSHPPPSVGSLCTFFRLITKYGNKREYQKMHENERIALAIDTASNAVHRQ